jgi:hypothetical protein
MITLTGVGVDGARNGRAITVRDAECAALLSRGRRSGDGVSAFRTADRTCAIRRRNPEVRRSSCGQLVSESMRAKTPQKKPTVKVDQERLRRATDGDGTSPLLAVVFVCQGLVLALAQTGGYGCQRLDLGTLTQVG